MNSQPDFPDSPPPTYQSGFNGRLDPASEDDRTQTSVGERSMVEGHDPYLGLAEPKMRRKDKLCFLGVILAFTVLVCAVVASIVFGVSVVGPYSTATGFVQSNCTNVSSTMGTEWYSCSCGRSCTKTCTRNCLRVNVSYTDQSSGHDNYALLRPDESYLNTQVNTVIICYYMHSHSVKPEQELEDASRASFTNFLHIHHTLTTSRPHHTLL